MNRTGELQPNANYSLMLANPEQFVFLSIEADVKTWNMKDPLPFTNKSRFLFLFCLQAFKSVVMYVMRNVHGVFIVLT